jgi:hypothetical protein
MAQLVNRRHFIGGSDARIIMGKDEKALHRLWREKRGEVAALDLSGVLIVQLGLVTEDLNRRWYEQNSGHRISDVQRHAIHRTIPWMAATLDGLVKETGAVFEAKYMLPCSFSERAAAEKHMAELQHNMLVAGTKKSVLSIINGGGKWIELTIEADPIYQTILIAAETAFWRAVKTGETPALFDCELPKPSIEAVRVVDMNASNSWAEFAGSLCETRQAHAEHERATDEQTSVPIDPTPTQTPSASMDPDKPRPRGRPGKVKAVAEQSAAPSVPSKPTIDDNPPATHHQANVAFAKIDKSELTISEPRRHRDKVHLKFVASQPCLVCGRSPADAHHLRFTQPRAMGRKVSDEFTVPLCRTHHRDNHRFGDEEAWWARSSINPVEVSRKLWVSTRRIE